MTTSIPAEELLAGDAKHLTLLDDGVELKALGARRLAADAFLRVCKLGLAHVPHCAVSRSGPPA